MDIPVGFFNLLKAYDVTNFQDIFQIIANVKESHGRDQVKESPSKKQIQVPLVNAHPPNHSWPSSLSVDCLAFRICTSFFAFRHQYEPVKNQRETHIGQKKHLKSSGL